MEHQRLETVIGLEIHVQLRTKSKMFCDCNNDAEHAAPNTLMCPVCVGHPGTLPSPNAQALRYAVRIGLALGCVINSPTFFDRKHYIYPDLPKGYQISQFDVPVCGEGALTVEVPGGERGDVTIRIERAHLEEDAAKNIHRDGKTLVDFNRAGTPLVEIVTRPDFRSPKEAKAFLQELRRIMRTIGVSDADMEKGHLRCDANISLRPVDERGLPIGRGYYPKTEIKNMNSFKAVERALLFEIARQTDLWQTNSPPAQTTTRGWNDAKQATELQRVKEDSADYRYMREPDIPPIDLSDVIDEERHALPELPAKKRARFRDEYGFSTQDVWALTDDPAVADFVERTMSELVAWLVASPETDGSPEEIVETHRAKLAKLTSTWIGNKLTSVLAARGTSIVAADVTPENMAELMRLVFERTLNNTAALTVLEHMLDSGS
ncbi:MAG: Asp-tRNA(Asn)/Glu-tRNA(Gln) amidotransferase subunit GatB, partial [Patescibacteria group bacterium]